MCKLNKWTIVKTLVFVGGVFTLYKLGTMNEGKTVFIDGQQFKVYGKDAGEYVKDIMKQTEF